MHIKRSNFGQQCLFPLIIAAISVIFQLLNWVEWLRYERALIESGQVWRLLSGNFVHLGWPHLLMNIMGFGLIWLIFGSAQSPLRWLIDILLASMVVGLGLYWFNPELVWYVGLSGILHGLFVVGLFLERTQSRGLFLTVLLGFIAKLVWEQYAGALPGSESVAGGAVIVDAHLYGSLAGGLALMCKRLMSLILPKRLNPESVT